MSIPSDNPKIVYGPGDIGAVAAAAGAVTLGSELVTNGTFTGAATGWTLAAGWAYSSNNILHTAGNVGTAAPTTALALTIGHRYEVTYTVGSRTAGSVTASLGGVTGTARSADGTYTERIFATAATNLAFTPSTDFDGTIDTVSVKRCGLDNATYYFAVVAFGYNGGYQASTKQLANATTSAGAGLGKVDLSWASVEYADGYRIYEDDSGYTAARLVATFMNGAWDVGTGTATTYTVQAATTVSGTPPAVTSPVTLWLPAKWPKWKAENSDRAKVTKGHTYIQRTAFPEMWEADGKTLLFTDSSENWDGSGSETFLTAWARFFTNWASPGKVFRFYKKATVSTAGKSYFARCVWDRPNDGIDRTLVGRERYALDAAFATEGAAR